MSKRKSESTIAPVEFIDRVIKLDKKGEPFSLAQYQWRVLEMVRGVKRDSTALVAVKYDRFTDRAVPANAAKSHIGDRVEAYRAAHQLLSRR